MNDFVHEKLFFFSVSNIPPIGREIALTSGGAIPLLKNLTGRYLNACGKDRERIGMKLAIERKKLGAIVLVHLIKTRNPEPESIKEQPE